MLQRWAESGLRGCQGPSLSDGNWLPPGGEQLTLCVLCSMFSTWVITWLIRPRRQLCQTCCKVSHLPLNPLVLPALLSSAASGNCAHCYIVKVCWLCSLRVLLYWAAPPGAAQKAMGLLKLLLDFKKLKKGSLAQKANDICHCWDVLSWCNIQVMLYTTLAK